MTCVKMVCWRRHADPSMMDVLRKNVDRLEDVEISYQSRHIEDVSEYEK